MALSCAAISNDSRRLITDGMCIPVRRTSLPIGCTWHNSAGSWTKKLGREDSGPAVQGERPDVSSNVRVQRRVLDVNELEKIKVRVQPVQ